MCGFIVTNIKANDFTVANKYVNPRGPDHTHIKIINGITFLHNLLSITGERTLQPFLENKIACLYNGEIYNHKQFGNFSSDGMCLLPAYMQYGKHFVNKLDGEFAIVLYDLENQMIRMYTDIFGTKPIHYGIRNDEFAVASYASAISALGFSDVKRIPANTMIEFNMNDNVVHIEKELYKFNLEQYKTSFDDWEMAFQNAIEKRTKYTTKDFFIGLSSGYDSGSISCELNLQKTRYKSYSIMGIEDETVLRKRMNLVLKPSVSELVSPTQEEIEEAISYIKNNIEDITLRIFSENSGHVEVLKLFSDPGAIGLCMICARAKKEGKKIYISGQGADEVCSDYGFGGKRYYPHSNFGGLFPEDLNEIFPWASFYGSSQQAYLTKEEYVAGSYGIETRYPFLDKKVVQEFLNLTHGLKNSCYKSSLSHYLKSRNYPTLLGQKIGFVPKAITPTA